MRDARWLPAYLLHTRPYRETSLLAEWFLPEQGRVGAVLRGARRRGQQAPAPFQPLFVQLVGDHELKTVSACEPAGPALRLQGGALFAGLYLNELLVRLAPRELPLPELFVAYAGALGELADLVQPAAADLEPVLRRFERQLLEAMGLGLDVPDIDPALDYRYQPGQGWLVGRAGRDGEVWSGQDILAVLADDFDTPARRRLAKRLYRSALQPLLGDRPLRSRELFASLQTDKSLPSVPSHQSQEPEA